MARENVNLKDLLPLTKLLTPTPLLTGEGATKGAPVSFHSAENDGVFKELSPCLVILDLCSGNQFFILFFT